jgi:hypothetical protein
MRKAMFGKIIPAAVLAIAASSPLQVSAFWSGPGCFIANMMTGGMVSGGVGFSLGGRGSRYGHVGGGIHPYGVGYPVDTLYPYGVGYRVDTLYPYGVGYPIGTLYTYGAGSPVGGLQPREVVYFNGVQSTIQTGSGWMSPVTPASTTTGMPRRAAELLEANVWAR